MKLATEVMDEAAADATIDEVMRRDPAKMVFPDDYIPLVDALRIKRALFIEADQKKQAKKQGIVEETDEDGE